MVDTWSSVVFWLKSGLMVIWILDIYCTVDVQKWQTKLNLVRLSNIPISDVWEEQLEQNPNPNRFGTGFVFDKPNIFVRISDIRLFYKR